MLNAKKCLKAGSILLAGTILLSVFPMMTLAKPAIEVITHAGAGGGTDVNSRMMPGTKDAEARHGCGQQTWRWRSSGYELF